MNTLGLAGYACCPSHPIGVICGISMRGRERNDAFFVNQKPKQTVSLQSKFKAARAQGVLNMSSGTPPLTSIPMEVFDLEKNIEEGEKFWEFEPLKSVDFSFNRITSIPNDICNLVDCVSMKFRDNQIDSVPEGLYEGCISLRHLDLGSNRITSISGRIINLIALKDLLLSSNHISAVPPELMECQSIVTLEIDHNKLRSLPDCRWRLSSLVTLNLAHNQLQQLPDSLGDCLALEVLNCGSNSLRSLPDLSRLTALRILDASQNALSQFPSLPRENSKHKLSHLILGYNRIAAIDIRVLLNHRNLSELLLHNNQLQEVPAEIEHIDSLKIIDVSNNNLRDLPATLGYMPALQHIRAEGNPIKVIRQHVIVKGGNELKAHLRSRGASLVQAAQLESAAEVDAVAKLAAYGTEEPATAYDNRAGRAGMGTSPEYARRAAGTAHAGAPSAVGHAAIGAATAAGGKLQPNTATIAAAQAQVADRIHFRIRDIAGSVLDLSGLSLTALPQDLADRVLAVPLGPTLVTISLANNQLTRLPVELQDLASIRVLGLAGNRLGTAQVIVSLAALPQVTSIDLSKNDLSAQALLAVLCGDSAGYGYAYPLTEIIANNNPLRSLPPELTWHRGLRTLRVSYCQLTTLDTIDLSALPQLQTLDVSNNKIAVLPQSLLSASFLEYLSVENNDLRDIPVELAALPRLKVLLIAGNPQRTVRTQVLQQGSAKVLEYLKGRIPAHAAVASAVGPARGARQETEVPHAKGGWVDEPDYSRQDRQEERGAPSHLAAPPSRRSPHTSVPPMAPALIHDRPAAVSRAPRATTSESAARMRGDLDYLTESSAYRTYERQSYLPQDAGGSGSQEAAVSAFQPRPRPRRLPDSDSASAYITDPSYPLHAPPQRSGVQGRSVDPTVFQAAAPSRYARSHPGQHSSVGDLLGGQPGPAARTATDARSGRSSNAGRTGGSQPYY